MNELNFNAYFNSIHYLHTLRKNLLFRPKKKKSSAKTSFIHTKAYFLFNALCVLYLTNETSKSKLEE